MARYVNESSEPSCCTWREGRMCDVDRHFHHRGLRQLFWLAPFLQARKLAQKSDKMPKAAQFPATKPNHMPSLSQSPSLHQDAETWAALAHWLRPSSGFGSHALSRVSPLKNCRVEAKIWKGFDFLAICCCQMLGTERKWVGKKTMRRRRRMCPGGLEARWGGRGWGSGRGALTLCVSLLIWEIRLRAPNVTWPEAPSPSASRLFFWLWAIPVTVQWEQASLSSLTVETLSVRSSHFSLYFSELGVSRGQRLCPGPSGLSLVPCAGPKQALVHSLPWVEGPPVAS